MRFTPEVLHQIEVRNENSLYSLLDFLGGLTADKIAQGQFVFLDDFDVEIGYMTAFIDNSGLSTHGNVKLEFNVAPHYRHSFLGPNKLVLRINVLDVEEEATRAREIQFEEFAADIKDRAGLS